jgi:ADP-dependent NAD(P)H-hydrate dehydratase / NAD(P)H-hydrate epimerase
VTSVRVVTAAQAAARDAAAIADGIPSGHLMAAAGRAAADAIARRYGSRLRDGVAVFAGPGNNGGDAWVVAHRLAALGARVRVCETGPSRTDDARAARDAALPHVSLGGPDGNEAVVVDGLLGTGAKGAPTGPIADAVQRILALRSEGAVIAALDIPTGLDATTGESYHGVVADVTVTFGTAKRGHLLARGDCGTLVVVDIGLGSHAELDDGAPILIDATWMRARVPPIAAEAHKGSRRRIAIIGGARGMAGAIILSARAAQRSGIGMVRAIVAEESLGAVQSAAVEATATTWPMDDVAFGRAVNDYAHAVALGPGLGNTADRRALAEHVLGLWSGPVVIDADGLNVFAGSIPSLAALLAGRPALITPHPLEMARLTAVAPEVVNAKRFEIGVEVARSLGAAVLLKGVPTIISAPSGQVLVSATGSPALAQAGSGDVLTGIATTLLAQIGDAFLAGACAAWAHGRAAELAGAGRPVRGIALEEVVQHLGDVWRFESPILGPDELLELPRVGDPR